MMEVNIGFSEYWCLPSILLLIGFTYFKYGPSSNRMIAIDGFNKRAFSIRDKARQVGCALPPLIDPVLDEFSSLFIITSTYPNPVKHLCICLKPKNMLSMVVFAAGHAPTSVRARGQLSYSGYVRLREVALTV